MEQEGIKSNESGGHIALFIIGFFCFAMGTGLGIVAWPSVMRNGDYPVLSVFLFSIIGAGIIYYAVQGFRRYKIIGPTLLTLTPKTGSVGGKIGGYFSVGSWWVDHETKITLSCVRITSDSDGTSRFFEWQDDQIGFVKTQGESTQVHFLFDIPENRKPTGKMIEWKIECKGTTLIDQNSIPLHRSWEVEVDNNTPPATYPTAIPAQFLEKRKRQEKLTDEKNAAEQIGLYSQQGRLVVVSERGRLNKEAWTLGIIGIVLLGLGGFLLTISWFIGGIFTLAGLINFVFGAVLAGRKLTALIDPKNQTLFLGRNWFSLQVSRKSKELSAPLEVSLKEGMKVSDANSMTVYYAIIGTSADHRFKIAEGIKGEDEAKIILDKIKSSLRDDRL